MSGNFCFSFVFGYGKYAYEVETKQKEKLPDIKKKLHQICLDIQVQNTEYMICGSKSG